MLFQAREGELVHFFLHKGQQYAQVSSRIGTFSREVVLPVVCSSGEDVASSLEVLSKDPSWYSQRQIHVLDRKVCPTLGAVVYVGALGLRGGGQGEASGSGSTPAQPQQTETKPSAIDLATQWKVVTHDGKLALQEVDGGAIWVPKESLSSLAAKVVTAAEGGAQALGAGLRLLGMEHNTIFSFMRSFSNYVSVADDADSDTEENTSSVAFNWNSGETVWFYPFNGESWVAYLPEQDSLTWVRAATPLSLSANDLRFVAVSTYAFTFTFYLGKPSNHVVVTTPADEIKKERNQRKQQRQEAKRLLEEKKQREQEAKQKELEQKRLDEQRRLEQEAAKKQREQEAKQKELEQKRLDEQRRLEQEAAKKQREQEAKQKELEQRRLDEQKQRIAAARQALVEKAVNQAAAYRTHFQQFWQSPAVQAQSANPPKAIQHLGSQPKDNTARKLQVSAAPPDQPIGDVQDNQEGQEVEYLGREQQSDKISSDPLAPATPSPQSQEAIVATAAQTPSSGSQLSIYASQTPSDSLAPATPLPQSQEPQETTVATAAQAPSSDSQLPIHASQTPSDPLAPATPLPQPQEPQEATVATAAQTPSSGSQLSIHASQTPSDPLAPATPLPQSQEPQETTVATAAQAPSSGSQLSIHASQPSSDPLAPATPLPQPQEPQEATVATAAQAPSSGSQLSIHASQPSSDPLPQQPPCHSHKNLKKPQLPHQPKPHPPAASCPYTLRRHPASP